MASDRTVPQAPYAYDDDSVATIRGGRFDYQTPGLIDIRDVARSLGAQPRYMGHTNEPFSIAQHSVACAALVRCWGESQLTQLTALLHDAAEAYCSDLPLPLRRQMREQGGVYDRIIERVEKMIAKKFGVPYPYPAAVQDADRAVYAYERRGISSHEHVDTSNVPDPPKPVAGILSDYWTPQKSRKAFMDMFVALS